MSSSVGSFTSTRWKRRASARSFSKCERYSWNVRRPDAAQPARGERGLEQVGRVHAAAARRAGADDRVDLVDEEDGAGDLRERLQHPLDALLEVAAVARAGERARPCRASRRRRSSSAFGTSPRLILSASPSAMAVLPTPGSPTRSGLFFFRRARIWMIRLDLVRAADERVDALVLRLLVEVDRVGLERVLLLLPRRLLAAPRERLPPRRRRPRRLRPSDPVRDVGDEVEPGDPRPLEQAHRERVALGEHRDQHVRPLHLVLARRRHVRRRAPDGVLHPHRGLRGDDRVLRASPPCCSSKNRSSFFLRSLTSPPAALTAFASRRRRGARRAGARP